MNIGRGASVSLGLSRGVSLGSSRGVSLGLSRGICTSSALQDSRKNFKRFNMYEKRLDRNYRKMYEAGKLPEFEHRFSRGVRKPFLPVDDQPFQPEEGDVKDRKMREPYPHHWEVPPNCAYEYPFITRAIWDKPRHPRKDMEFVPEMVPELVVPDLAGFRLKPYVSYRTPDVKNEAFTAESLFEAIYAKKIVEDFKAGRLAEDGSPVEPSEEELLSAEEARLRARQTGSDYV